MLFYWFLKFVAIGPAVTLVFRPRAEGTEHVPATGAAILASNHLSAADWIYMPLSLKRRVTFLAKAEYFTGTGVKGFLQRVFFAGSGQVPIDRTDASAAEDAIRTGLRHPAGGQAARDLPRGHPLARRPPLPGQDRRRPDDPGDRRARSSRSR